MKKLVFLTLITFSSFAQTIVNTENGIIEGYENHSIRIFKGIPFAAPPVDEFRWKAPQPVQNWSGVKKCNEFSMSFPSKTEKISFLLYILM